MGGPQYHLPPVVTIALVVAYYALFEILPCAVVLWYYRRLPPRPPSYPAAVFYAEDRNQINDSSDSDGLRRSLM